MSTRVARRESRQAGTLAEEQVMLSDLAALTPPLVVCLAVIVAVVLFLRHQMAPKRGANAKRRTGDDE